MTSTTEARLAEGLRDHWRWRPEWTAQRVCLWWYLTLAPHPGLEEMLRRLGHGLGRTGAVDVVPRGWLHLTLQEVGYADQLPRRLDGLLKEARRALAEQPPITLELGRPTSLPSAVVLPAGPARPLADLRERLCTATRRFAGEQAPLLHPVAPHVSLAYVNREVAAEDVLSEVRDVDVAPVDVPASAVTLAAVTRRDRHYQWSDLGSLRLGAA
jgi:2'-5' RNA ligase